MENFCDANVIYLDCGYGYMNIYICQNSLSCIDKTSKLLYANYINKPVQTCYETLEEHIVGLQKLIQNGILKTLAISDNALLSGLE